jgi:hypothetical protein
LIGRRCLPRALDPIQHRNTERIIDLMTSKKITIPADIDAAVADLNGLGALITAKEWHRAAIVAAYVTLGEKHVHIDRDATSSISPVEFAALGIVGLKSKDTVRRYVENWTKVAGLAAPRPGEIITLPDKTWPAGSTYEAGPAGAVKRIVDQPGTVAEALKDETFREKVLAKVDADSVIESVAKANPKAAAKVAAKTMKTEEGRKAIATEMVKSGEAASVEKVAAATREESVRTFLASDEGKDYEKGKKETGAAEEALKDRLARTGSLSLSDVGLLLLSSLHAMEEFSELADSVSNRVEPSAADTLREIGNRHKTFGQYLIDLADGKNPTKLSDADLEALLSGGV